jgi:hypothetical protein
MSYYSSLTQHGQNIYADDMEAQIAAEARGVTRKDVPLDAQPGLDIDSVQKIGIGNWEEGEFWDRLHKTLHGKVCCPGRVS